MLQELPWLMVSPEQENDDSKWVQIGGNSNNYYSDVIFYKDKFFATNSEWVEFWDIGDSSPVKLSVLGPFVTYASLATLAGWNFLHQYLVESFGDLFLIDRYVDRYKSEMSIDRNVNCSRPVMSKTLLFRVFRFSSSSKVFEEVQSLDDRVLFWGTNQSKCVSPRSNPRFEGNLIYFTEDNWTRELNADDGDYDLGVFNMENKSFKRCCPNRIQQRIEPPPFWIDPLSLLSVP